MLKSSAYRCFMVGAVVVSALFDEITDEIYQRGYFIKVGAVPESLLQGLNELHVQRTAHFQPAGVGRNGGLVTNKSIRRDSIDWIDSDNDAGKAWNAWASSLQAHLNRRLYLGLGFFESHFARYKAGDFYRKHSDAFRGETNRILTVLTYLNRHWLDQDGGELVLYDSSGETEIERIKPEFGTLVVFLSEEFPHEVLPSCRERLSIAAWFRAAPQGFI